RYRFRLQRPRHSGRPRHPRLAPAPSRSARYRRAGQSTGRDVPVCGSAVPCSFPSMRRISSLRVALEGPQGGTPQAVASRRKLLHHHALRSTSTGGAAWVALTESGTAHMLAIEEIYDAAFDRERFPRLIELLGQAFGAQSGFI